MKDNQLNLTNPVLQASNQEGTSRTNAQQKLAQSKTSTDKRRVNALSVFKASSRASAQGKLSNSSLSNLLHGGKSGKPEMELFVPKKQQMKLVKKRFSQQTSDYGIVSYRDDSEERIVGIKN